MLSNRKTRDRLIYRQSQYIGPTFGFYLYISISLSRCWQNACYIPHTYKQLAHESTMNQVKTVNLAVTPAGSFLETS